MKDQDTYAEPVPASGGSPLGEEMLHSAAQLLAQGRVGQVQALCQELRKQEGYRSRALTILANIALFSEGDAEKAASLCLKAMDQSPPEADLARLLGQALGCQGRWEEAREVLGQVLDMAPRDAATLLELAQLACRLGDWDQALSLQRRAMSLNPGAPDYTPFIGHMARWLSQPLAPEGGGRDQPQTLFCLPVWGRPYLEAFLTYCLPSLLHESNLPALAQWRLPAFRFHTDQEGRDILARAPEIARLARLASIQVELIPPDFHKWPGGTVTGWLHHVTLHEAIRRQADCCLLYSESFFSQGSFAYAAQVMAGGDYDVLASQGINIASSGLPHLASRRDPADGSLGIPARQLVDLVLTHLSPRTRDYLGSPRPGLFSADSSNLLYADGRGLVMRTLQPLPYYISHRVLRPGLPFNYTCADNGLLDALADGPQGLARIKWTGHSDNFLNVGLELGQEEKRVNSSRLVAWEELMKGARRKWTPARAWAFARELRFEGNQPPPPGLGQANRQVASRLADELGRQKLRSRRAFV